VAGLLFFAAYFRKAFRQARQQRLVASKLEAHLVDYSLSLFDEPFREYLFLGHFWEEKQVLEAVDRGALQNKDIEDIKKELQCKLMELKSSIELGEEEFYNSLIIQHNHYRKMSPDLFSYIIGQIEKEQNRLQENISFISEQEAAILPSCIALSAMQAKWRLNTILDKTLQVAVALRNMESLNLKTVSNELYEVIENVIFFSKNFFPLLNRARIASEQFILSATIRNMLLMKDCV